MTSASQAAVPRPWPVGRPLGMVLLLCAVLAGAIAGFNGGVFTYTLDDPYIHLALAANLAEFHYGLAPGSFAAPSSSILWPALLAPFAALPGFAYAPLALNLVCLAANVALLQAILRGVFGDTDNGWLLADMLTIAAVLALNLVGLAFTGMEHELQVALALAVLQGVRVVWCGDRPPAWLAAAMVLGPLVRYESLSLTLGAGAVLFVRGHRRLACTAIAVALLLLAAFSLFLLSLGLPALPSSVLNKLVGQPPGMGPVLGLSDFVLRRLHDLFFEPHRAVIFAALATLASAALMRRRHEHAGVLGVMALVGAGHLALGRWDALARYEIYALAVLLAGSAIVFAADLRRLTARYRPLTVALLGCLALALVFGRNVGITAKTPLAASNIYEQQYQLRRFVTEFHPSAVAVNDLGLVSFRNPYPVLDLWGLGSDAARRAWRTEAPGWIGRMAAARAVPLAMIYTQWFAPVASIPDDWTLVGRLFLGGPMFSVGSNPVDFYVTPAGDIDYTRGRLQAFAASLPPGVTLEIR